MQTNILWTGREYYSLENCLLTTAETGSKIRSVIVGRYEEEIYRVEYVIKTNENWATRFVKLECQHKNKIQHLSFESDGNGNWTLNGKPAEDFKGCLDIDVPLTPFTNTLPINRLKLRTSEEKEIRVIYCDLLKEEMKPVTQKYIRLSDTEYHYENVPNDFEAIIKVDELGLVADYPELFVRTALQKTNYPQ
jgi:hypothetical protein